VDPLAIPLVDWKKEYTCAGLNKAFKAWMSRQKKVRAYFLHQLHSCQQSDTSCIRGYLRKLVFIHQTNKKGTEEFAHRMTKCDTCALIKLRFARWLKRAISRRARAHLSMGLCSNTDSECLDRHVARVRAITIEIQARRKKVLAEHGECVKATTTTKAAPPATSAPPVRASSASTIMASIGTISAVIIAAVIFI
jgi:hypothetical protein